MQIKSEQPALNTFQYQREKKLSRKQEGKNVNARHELSGPGVNKCAVNYTGFFDYAGFYADCPLDAFRLVPGPAGTP
jgi:hypothetical protein